MATGKQLKAAILARRVARGPRKKRTRPKPRQYTIADFERARDRVAAAERRIDNDRTNNPNRGRAGLERAQLELHIIESQLRLPGEGSLFGCTRSRAKNDAGPDYGYRSKTANHLLVVSSTGFDPIQTLTRVGASLASRRVSPAHSPVATIRCGKVTPRPKRGLWHRRPLHRVVLTPSRMAGFRPQKSNT
jgi:hypothetical protein